MVNQFPLRKLLNEKVLGLFLVMALLVAALPQPAVAASNEASQNCTWYRVQRGDTLLKIAKRFGVDWRDLVEANDIKNPNIIYPNKLLCIPGGGSGKAGRGSFTASIDGNFLVINTSNLPTKSSFFVRVDDAHERGYKWTKVGVLRTNKSGSVEDSFRLTGDLRFTSLLNVCLKNIYTDKVICGVAR
jgi:LysM repeat protein